MSEAKIFISLENPQWLRRKKDGRIISVLGNVNAFGTKVPVLMLNFQRYIRDKEPPVYVSLAVLKDTASKKYLKGFFFQPFEEKGTGFWGNLSCIFPPEDKKDWSKFIERAVTNLFSSDQFYLVKIPPGYCLTTGEKVEEK